MIWAGTIETSWHAAIRRRRFVSPTVVWLGMVCALVLGAWEARAAAPKAKEYEVKAAFLLNFAQYVEWPPEVFLTPTAPILIGILGNDPFGKTLDQTIRGETVNDHPIEIRRSKQLQDLKHCHLLFINRSEKGKLSQILAGLAGKHCLTVSEMDHFAHNGGVIGFRVEESDIRFEINLDAARRSGLTISSKLLRLAIVIGSERKEESK